MVTIRDMGNREQSPLQGCRHLLVLCLSLWEKLLHIEHLTQLFCYNFGIMNSGRTQLVILTVTLHAVADAGWGFNHQSSTAVDRKLTHSRAVSGVSPRAITHGLGFSQHACQVPRGATPGEAASSLAAQGPGKSCMAFLLASPEVNSMPLSLNSVGYQTTATAKRGGH